MNSLTLCIHSNTCTFCLQGVGKKKGKSNRNKKANKSKSSQRKNPKKTNMPHGGNDLTQKVYATMEKHKEVSPWELFPLRLRLINS